MGSFKGSAIKLLKLDVRNKLKDNEKTIEREGEVQKNKETMYLARREEHNKICKEKAMKLEQKEKVRLTRLEEQKKNRREKELKVQQAREQKAKEWETRVENQNRERLEKMKQIQVDRLAMNKEIQRKRDLAIKRAQENEERRRIGFATRQQRIQVLQDEKQFSVLRKREQEKIDRLDQLRLQEIKEANIKMKNQKVVSSNEKITNLGRQHTYNKVLTNYYSNKRQF